MPKKTAARAAAALALLCLQACGDGDPAPSTPSICQSACTVSGTVQYEDREVDLSGFTGNKTLQPVRFADMELVRSADGAVLASSVTDASGGFSTGFTNTGAAGVYVRILSRTADPSILAEVTQLDGSLYAVVSGTLNDAEQTALTASLTASAPTQSAEGAGGAFHILDALVEGSEFVRSLSGQVPPQVTARWESGSSLGTFYSPALGRITLNGGSGPQAGDHDEYDDAVILHEYGHHIGNHFSKDDSPGGIHFLSDNTQDIRLAWSEGWATFFAAAVLNSSLYIDTVGGDPPANGASAFDLETRPAGSPLTYTTSEGAVATVLWDLFDAAAGESFDALDDKMQEVWDVFSLNLPLASRVGMEEFWDGWFDRGLGLTAEMQNVTQDREMDFIQDPAGSNDAPDCSTPLALDATVEETLYASGSGADADYFCVVLTQDTSYTLQAANLSNGADPFLELLSPALVVAASNDNGADATDYSDCETSANPTLDCPANSAAALAAGLQFVPTVSGNYHARISRSASAPPSSGRYGSYQFWITSP